MNEVGPPRPPLSARCADPRDRRCARARRRFRHGHLRRPQASCPSRRPPPTRCCRRQVSRRLRSRCRRWSRNRPRRLSCRRRVRRHRLRRRSARVEPAGQAAAVAAPARKPRAGRACGVTEAAGRAAPSIEAQAGRTSQARGRCGASRGRSIAVPQPAGDGHWAIRLGAFQSDDHAKLLVDTLKVHTAHLGADRPRDTTGAGAPWFFVRTPSYATRAEAEAVAKRLRDKEHVPAIVFELRAVPARLGCIFLAQLVEGGEDVFQILALVDLCRVRPRASGPVPAPASEFRRPAWPSARSPGRTPRGSCRSAVSCISVNPLNLLRLAGLPALDRHRTAP